MEVLPFKINKPISLFCLLYLKKFYLHYIKFI